MLADLHATPATDLPLGAAPAAAGPQAHGQAAQGLDAAIAYMQKLEGEKHLVFIAESSLSLPRGAIAREIGECNAAELAAVDDGLRRWLGLE